MECFHLAESFIVFRRAPGDVISAQLGAVCVDQFKLNFFAVKVIAVRDPPIDAQCLGVFYRSQKLESLLGRQ